MLILIFRRLETRRRQAPRYHMIGRGPDPLRRQVVRGSFIFILATFSIATWVIALHIRPAAGAPLIFAWNVGLIALLLIKPYRRRPMFINN